MKFLFIISPLIDTNLLAYPPAIPIVMFILTLFVIFYQFVIPSKKDDIAIALNLSSLSFEIVIFYSNFSYRNILYSNHATALIGEPSLFSIFSGKQLNRNKSLPQRSKFLRFSILTISQSRNSFL